MRNVIRRITLMTSSLLSILIDFLNIQPQLVALFTSFPDYDDHTFAMILELQKDAIPIILVCDNFDIPTHWSEENIKLTLVKRNSLKSLYHAKRSQYIFHTHGFSLTESISRKQKVTSLWHGIPLKRIGQEIGNKMPQSTFGLVTSSATSFLMKRAYSESQNLPIFLNFGLPRLDLLRNNITKEPYSLVNFIWMPTYRKSVVGEIREDGFVNDLGIGMTADQLQVLDKGLQTRGISVELLLHPMSGSKIPLELTSIKLSQLDRKKESLYRYINKFDALITDYSSISVDYLITQKPLYILAPDYEEYAASRGLFDELENLLGLTIFKNVEDFLQVLDLKHDPVQELKGAFLKWHDYQGDERARNIWKAVLKD